MRVALCQIDTTVGDFAGNVDRILGAAERAAAEGAQLAVFPELAVCGYPAEDLLLRDAFLDDHDRALRELARPPPAGPPRRGGGGARAPPAAAGGWGATPPPRGAGPGGGGRASSRSARSWSSRNAS
ncbi:MAG: nitrilase-related carbon-nitrogen hydrolase, partial [Planctomycetota bacterium]